MTERALKLGQKVEVTGKDVRGSVAYIGHATFAAGKWIGVVLDSPKGKNNGTVQGKTYFQCDENCGMFVRSSQLTILEDAAAVSPSGSGSTESIRTRSSMRKTGAPSKTPVSTRKLPRKSSSPTHQAKKAIEMRLPVPGTKSTSQTDVAELTVTPLKETAQSSETSSKKASFVETGFVETLKPQYTPGQALSPGICVSIEDRLSNLQQSIEIDRLNGEIRDLNEKLETLRVKRAQDKEKFKELDKARIQIEQLMEFKSRIMESQAALQRDLVRARQETKEAIEAKELHAEEMADLTETVEMATLDKEMAEEKAEALQMELEQAKERIDMLTMDVELLRAEVGGLGVEESGGDGKVKSSITLEMKQLEQQNLKLRETLVKLRDLSAHEKHESQKLQKELEMRRSEIAELSRTKEKLSARQEELEQMRAYLQEQVDAAMGAEEMVENLTTKNLNLEERVKELEEAVSDLEALGDMNEQLQEGSRELELELREELDMAQAARREALRERDAILETLADRELTINKFREHVQKQQEEVHELRDQIQRETSRPLSAMPEMIDFKKMFAESKAHTKAIDLELRRIDVQQSNQHVQYLTAYMPESFLARGGDHDAMLLLLLLPRLLRKADIIVEQVRDKFPAVQTIDRAAVLRSHSVEQFSFRSRLGFWIYSLQGVLEFLLRSLTSCSPDTLLKVGVLYSDLALQERAVDALVELLRHDQLDENASLEALEKCVVFCQAICSSHLPPANESHMPQLAACCRALSSACDVLYADASSVFALLQAGAQDTTRKVIQEVVTTAETLRQQLKLCRRRLHGGSLGIELSVSLSTAQDHAGKIVNVMHDTLRACMQYITASGDADTGVESAKVLDFLQSSAEHIAEGDTDPVQSLRASLSTVENAVSNFAKAVQDGEYDLEPKREDKMTPPIVVRAQCVKKELEETKMLRQKLETREGDIKELKKAMKLKQEELSEMVIRKDLAESKLGNVHKDYSLTTEKLQRKLDDCQMMLRRKEKEFEETMDHLQADIDSLESERGELKERLKSISKKAMIEGLAKSVATSGVVGGASLGSGGPSLPVTVRDSPMLVQQVHDLRLALGHAQNEALRSHINAAKAYLTKIPPLKVGKKAISDGDNKVADLSKKSASLLKELHQVLANPVVVDISQRKAGEIPILDKNSPSYQLAQRTAYLQKLKSHANKLEAEVLEYVMNNKPGAKAQSRFAAFPTNEFAKVLNEEEARCVGHISLPQKSAAASHKVPVMLDIETLRKLHNTMNF